MNIWEWSRSGPWFRVPIANFVGWFFIIFGITAGYLLIYLFTINRTFIVRFFWSLMAILLESGPCISCDDPLTLARDLSCLTLLVFIKQ